MEERTGRKTEGGGRQTGDGFAERGSDGRDEPHIKTEVYGVVHLFRRPRSTSVKY